MTMNSHSGVVGSLLESRTPHTAQRIPNIRAFLLCICLTSFLREFRLPLANFSKLFTNHLFNGSSCIIPLLISITIDEHQSMELGVSLCVSFLPICWAL